MFSFPRIHAVPLQPTDHAHFKQHTTHLHSLPLYTEPPAAAACSWSTSDSAACVAVSAVGAIWDPFWQWLSPAATTPIPTKDAGTEACLFTPLSQTRTNLVHWQVDGVIWFFILVLWHPLAVSTEYKQQPLAGWGSPERGIAFGPEALTQPVGENKQNLRGLIWAVVKMKNLLCTKKQHKRLFLVLFDFCKDILCL